jgi:hypothetical protein
VWRPRRANPPGHKSDGLKSFHFERQSRSVQRDALSVQNISAEEHKWLIRMSEDLNYDGRQVANAQLQPIGGQQEDLSAKGTDWQLV